MKANNPTPTTLRDLLGELFMRGLGSTLDDVESAEEKDRGILNLQKHYTDQATQSIQEQLKALLPKKKTGTIELGDYPESEIDQIEEDAGVVITYRQGFNSAIDQIQKAIEEWAK